MKVKLDPEVERTLSIVDHYMSEDALNTLASVGLYRLRNPRRLVVLPRLPALEAAAGSRVRRSLTRPDREV